MRSKVKRRSAFPRWRTPAVRFHSCRFRRRYFLKRARIVRLHHQRGWHISGRICTGSDSSGLCVWTWRHNASGSHREQIAGAGRQGERTLIRLLRVFGCAASGRAGGIRRSCTWTGRSLSGELQSTADTGWNRSVRSCGFSGHEPDGDSYNGPWIPTLTQLHFE